MASIPEQGASAGTSSAFPNSPTATGHPNSPGTSSILDDSPPAEIPSGQAASTTFYYLGITAPEALSDALATEIPRPPILVDYSTILAPSDDLEIFSSLAESGMPATSDDLELNALLAPESTFSQIDAAESIGSTTESVHSTEAKRQGYFHVFLKNIGLAIISFWQNAFRGDDSEKKKVVISRSRRLALIRCSVHILPILGTIALAAINLNGVFIGGEYLGLSGAAANAVDTLALQITAKLMELLIVASLGTVILDVVRHETMFGAEGLPFGLFVSHLRFKDISYFWSSSFWSSKGSIRRARRKWMLLGSLFVVGLIANTAGPSSALLMLPTSGAWPGGGTPFYLIGNYSSLWPSYLGKDSVGGSACLSPSSEMLSRDALNTSGCIWYSTSSLAQNIKDWHLNDLISKLTIVDISNERSITYIASMDPTYLDTWAVSSSAAIGLISSQIYHLWLSAIYYAPIVQPYFSFYHTLKYRIRSATTATVQSPLPVVRTRCNTYAGSFDHSNVVEFPFLPEYDYGQDWGYWLNVSFDYPSTIVTQWLEIPQGSTPTSNNNQTDYYPSAFLHIQVPDGNVTGTGTMFTCSIDARWALGNHIITEVFNQDANRNLDQHGEILSIFVNPLLDGYGFSPVNDGTWSRVAMDLDWLYTLTPVPNSPLLQSQEDISGPRWTSLASLLQDSGFDNRTGLVEEWASIRSPIEGVIAMLVAEGMARVGMSDNGGQAQRLDWVNTPEAVLNLYENEDDSLNALLQNGVAVLPPQGVSASNLTQLHWDVTAYGFFYKANSVAYYLALTVLFSYVIFALVHIIYCLYTRHSSEAWDTYEELLTLCHNSTPLPELMVNTSAGIGYHGTLRRSVKLRAAPGPERTGLEEIQLLFDLKSEDDYRKIEVDKAYGTVS